MAARTAIEALHAQHRHTPSRPRSYATLPPLPTHPPFPQLALWKRYDEDGNGVLSRGELAHVVADYASARVLEIEKEELPKLRLMMEAEGSNQFLLLISRARMMAKEAELQLFKSQSEGQIAAADINDAFHKLDANHDGSISKDEFLKGATDVLFHNQLTRIKNWKSLRAL